jgi:hypothetical protein
MSNKEKHIQRVNRNYEAARRLQLQFIVQNGQIKSITILKKPFVIYHDWSSHGGDEKSKCIKDWKNFSTNWIRLDA